MDSTTHMMEFLPAIFEGGAGPANQTRTPFLHDYLLPFQKILMGWDDGYWPDSTVREPQALSRQIDRFSDLLDPERSPTHFLPWLSSWVALNIIAPITEMKRRELIARFISLNRIRGTKRYLEELLPFFVDAGVAVKEEQAPECAIGIHSTLGHDFQIGGGPAHTFRVVLNFPAINGEALDSQCRTAHYIIQISKPAHTRYELEVNAPTFQIGVHSSVGRDTVLG